MSLQIVPVTQIFGRYEQQTRIAELNKKTPVKTIQNQVDRVTISPEARQAQVTGNVPGGNEARQNNLYSVSKEPNVEPAPSGTKSASESDFQPMVLPEDSGKANES